MISRFASDLTVTDVFCGAGGNTIGAKRAGLRVRVGLNHWQRAVDTYKTNNDEVDVVERVDVSLCDPRRYPSTDIGIFSPECTTHSPAGGNKHRPQWDLFDQKKLDPATVRSRVTMFDVVRFTEFHRYRLVIVENVVEATRWELFPSWLEMMDHLGYSHRLLSLNSMFFHPTPQSRDRIYVVFWKKGNRAPDLEYRPVAPCGRCASDVHAVQAWKSGRSIGKYRRQYVYACPRCASTVTPYYYAALNALDFTLAADRIGDRPRALRPRTMERIRFGLEKYGRRSLVVNVKQGERDSSRAWPADTRELGTVPTWDNYYGVAQPSPFLVHLMGNGRPRDLSAALPTQLAECAHDALVQPSPFLVRSANGGQNGVGARGLLDAMPTATCVEADALVQPGFLIETAQSHSERRRPRGLEEPLPTMGTQLTSALVSPFIVSAGSRQSTAAGSDPMPTQTASERLGVVSPFLVTLRTHADAASIDGPAPAVCASGNHHAIVSGAAQISMRDANAMRVAGLDAELLTQGCGPQHAIMSRAPYLVSYYGADQASSVAAAVPAVTTVDRHGIVSPSALRVEDCYFRMLQPHEIGAAMAFPTAYEVGGTKRDKVKQYGNAVTPPVMDWLVRQCAATLAPELNEAVA